MAIAVWMEKAARAEARRFDDGRPRRAWRRGRFKGKKRKKEERVVSGTEASIVGTGGGLEERFAGSIISGSSPHVAR